MKQISNLNNSQLKAVTHRNGPLLVIAGAGTGKTTVITERIKHLILERNLPTGAILALTFTDKAAFEMQERIDQIMPYGYSDMWIQTFHSFCDRILRDEALSIGLDPHYTLMTEAESIQLVKNHIFDLDLSIFRPLANPTKFIEALLTHFSRLKDEDINPKQYQEFAESRAKKMKSKFLPDDERENIEKILELSRAYTFFEELKIKEGVMDFSDLISHTLTLFRARKSVLKQYQSKFQFILVDEFQDTNFAQNELAILLAGDDQNITVVADDDQAIYRWRGAAVSNVMQFKKNFKNAKIVTLIENYRSSQSILDAAYEIIQNNNPDRLEVIEKIDKHLVSKVKRAEDKLELIHTDRIDQEAESVALKIKSLVDKGYSYKDIAILVRANNHSTPFAESLYRYKIPFQFLGPGYLFHQEEIKDLIAYLKVLYDLTDNVSLYRVLSMPVFEISYIELNYVLNEAKRKNAPLFEILDSPDFEFIKDDTRKKLIHIKDMITHHINRSKKDSAGQILYYFLQDSGIYQNLLTVNSQTEEKQALNIAKFFDRIKSYESERESKDIYSVVDWINLMMALGESPLAASIDWKDYDAVNILTVHSSKGLEFPVVFIVNLVADRFPTRERQEKIPIDTSLVKEKLPEGNYHLQEERRLFYVALTRAKEKVFLTASDYYGAGKRAKKLSPFVYETIPDLLGKIYPAKQIKQLSLAEISKGYHVQEVIEQKVKPVKITHISFSNLQMFNICPLHYKAKVLLGIPTDQTQVQTFGISVHNALQTFYKNAKDNKKISESDLLDALKSEWITQGYESKKHEEERLKEAIVMLKEFYKKYFNPHNLPIALEMPFSFFLSNGVKVSGKIDRIDRLAGNQLEIIDYKTGAASPKAQKPHELQLAIYALAASKIKHEFFTNDADDITLTLIFLKDLVKKSMRFTEKELHAQEEKIITQIQEMEKSDFACSKNVLCLTCEYKMLCNAYI